MQTLRKIKKKVDYRCSNFVEAHSCGMIPVRKFHGKSLERWPKIIELGSREIDTHEMNWKKVK